MLENGKIGKRQFTVLVTMNTVGDAILFLPSIPAFEAKQDAWMPPIIGLAVGLLIVYLFTIVSKLYPRLTVVEYSEKILGTGLGKAVSLLFLAYAIISAASTLRGIGDFMTTYFMPETPIQAFIILYLGVVIMGIRLGLETLARAAEMLFPSFIVLVLIFVLLLIPQMELDHILPVFEDGIKPVLRGSIASIAFPFAELVVFLMIIPYVKQSNRIGSSFMLGATLGGIILIAIVALTILVLGADLAARSMYPGFSLAKKISIGDFLQRLEAILAIIWFITIYIKTSLYFYVATLGIAQVFRLRESRSLTLPLGMIIVALSLLVTPNVTYYNEVISACWPFFDFTFSILMPIVLLAVYALRKKLKRNS